MMKTKIVLFFLLLFSTFSCKKDKPSPYPTNGLISYFNFDDNLVDQQGYAKNGVGNAIFAPGKIGNGLSFNGTDQQMVLSPKVPQPNDKISLAFWVNPANEGNFLMGNQDVSNLISDDFYMLLYQGSIHFAIEIPSQSDQGPSVNYLLNEWNHIVATFDGTEAKIYINGVLGDSQNVSTSITGFNKNIILGRQDQVQNYWQGLIDELYIYNRALTQAEVTQLYNLK